MVLIVCACGGIKGDEVSVGVLVAWGYRRGGGRRVQKCLLGQTQTLRPCFTTQKMSEVGFAEDGEMRRGGEVLCVYATGEGGTPPTAEKQPQSRPKTQFPRSQY